PLMTQNTDTARTVPHETARQAAIHTPWPAAHDLWEEDIEPARDEFARFLALAAAPAADGKALPIVAYAATAEAEADARRRLGRIATVVREPYGDVWARDTGPVFVRTAEGLKGVRFRFNGWGGKYDLPGDQTVGARIAREAGAAIETADFVCEGGALEFDGEGTCITTRQCLLNANRNPRLSEKDVENRLEAHLGVKKVVWLDEGLMNDHTDGHVDNIARFAAPGLVVCQSASGPDDPNARVYDKIAKALMNSTDAHGRRLSVLRVPSPGLVQSDAGEPAAASHMNWVVGPRHVVVPAYNDRARLAARALQRAFPGREVVVSGSNAILTGGGSFHCVTCNQPAG
ncbi:MAG: agmatine deiminase family protein, partial [Oceanicaulis sp.]